MQRQTLLAREQPIRVEHEHQLVAAPRESTQILPGQSTE
jgi:hypothetical protein